MPSATQSRGRVLVVDDDAGVRGLLLEALPISGFEVVAVASGEAALETLRLQTFDLVITDLMMPGMDGVQTLTAVKALDPDIEVILATGNATVETAVAGIKHGAYDYIHKPIHLSALAHQLGRAMEKRRLQGLASLYASAQKLLGSLDHPEPFELVVEVGESVARADDVVLVPWPAPEGGTLVRTLVRARRDEDETNHADDGFVRALAGRATAAGEVVRFTPGLPLDPPLAAAQARFVSGVACPLIVRSEALGALVFLRGAGHSPFAGAETRRIEMYAAQAAMALDNLRLYGQVRDHWKEMSRTHERLVVSEAHTRAIIDTAHEAILTMDPSGAVGDVNERAEVLFGLDREQLRGRPFVSLLGPGPGRERVAETLRRYLVSGEPPLAGQVIETVALGPGGEARPVELSIAAAAISGGHFFSAFVRDVSERKRLEIELRHAQKLESVGRLAAGIAHEINTPIQFVGDNTHFFQDCFRNLSELLLAYGTLRDAARAGTDTLAAVAAVERAEAAADVTYLLEEVPTAVAQTLDGIARVASIVKAMKEFAHPDGRKMAAADLNQALASTLTVARNELKYVAEVETDFGELPPVMCHIGDLNTVFLNLLVNAAHAVGDRVKAEGGKGTIRVRTRSDAGAAVVAISDTGSGIPESIRERIFDPFFTTKEVGRGTGQGLALARAIVVDKHSGSLTFESSAGQGTTFFVSLPVAGAAAATDEGSVPAEPVEVMG